jgi:predicted house-cleaning noncanonical NTP pyrophosphatase (MazG superfamily)
VDVNAPENLQALCFACNRAKRDADETDFRRRDKLVRDRIPEIIEAEGRRPIVRELIGQKLRTALLDKLVEEHAELLNANDSQHRLEELADIAEVIFALAGQYGADEKALLALVREKRNERGGFEKGYLYCGDAAPKRSA